MHFNFFKPARDIKITDISHYVASQEGDGTNRKGGKKKDINISQASACVRHTLDWLAQEYNENPWGVKALLKDRFIQDKPD